MKKTVKTTKTTKTTNKTRRQQIKRKGARPKNLLPKRLTKEEKKMHSILEEWMTEDAPQSRAECKYGIRPCPYVRCRYHLYLNVKPNGSLDRNFLGEPWEIRESCALDVAEQGGHTLEQVGQYMNLTRERVRQIESEALAKLAAAGLVERDILEEFKDESGRLAAYMDYLVNGPSK